jgi:hypothetical protein
LVCHLRPRRERYSMVHTEICCHWVE